MELLLSQVLLQVVLHYLLGLGGLVGRLRWQFQVRVGLEKRGRAGKVGLFRNLWLLLRLLFDHFLSQWLLILNLYLSAKIYCSHIN